MEHINDNDDLLQLNDSWARKLTPVAVYLGIVLVVGVIGNVTVLIVYSMKFKKTTSTIFILILAIVDLITCLLAIPYHFISITYPFIWVWGEVCKIFTFTLFLTVISSILLLDLIAFDRYCKICKPFKRQLSPGKAKTFSVVAILVSCLLSIPSLFIYGITIVETRTENITGTHCFVLDKFSNTTLNTAYDISLLALYIILITFMIILYINVGKTVLKLRALKRKRQTIRHANVEKNREDKISRETFDSGAPSGVNVKINAVKVTGHSIESLKQCVADDNNRYFTTTEHSDKRTGNDGKVNHTSGTLTTNCNSNAKNGVSIDKSTNQPVDNQKPQLPIEQSQSKTEKVNNPDISKPSTRQSSITSGRLKTLDAHDAENVQPSIDSKTDKKLETRIRITLMLSVVTIVFIISFLPYLVVTVLGGDANSEFWKKSSTTAHVIFGILLRSYLISSMSNPIIYWFLNQRFKDEVKKMLKGFPLCKRKQ